MLYKAIAAPVTKLKYHTNFGNWKPTSCFLATRLGFSNFSSFDVIANSLSPKSKPSNRLTQHYDLSWVSLRQPNLHSHHSALNSIIPPPRTFSPSYQTAACPGVMLNWGSSNTKRTREFSKGITVTASGLER